LSKKKENDNYLINTPTKKNNLVNVSQIKSFTTPKSMKESSPTPSSPPVVGTPLKNKTVPKFDTMDKTTINPLIGKRIKVYWPDKEKYYPGTIIKTSSNEKEGTHEVLYDDDPADTVYEFLEGKYKAKWKEI